MFAVAAGSLAAVVILLLGQATPKIYELLVNFAAAGFFAAYLFPLIGGLVARRRGSWLPGPFNLGRASQPIAILAAIFALAQFLNIAWPRPIYPHWYLNWAVWLVTGTILITGAILYRRFAARITTVETAAVDDPDETSTVRGPSTTSPRRRPPPRADPQGDHEHHHRQLRGDRQRHDQLPRRPHVPPADLTEPTRTPRSSGSRAKAATPQSNGPARLTAREHSGSRPTCASRGRLNGTSTCSTPTDSWTAVTRRQPTGNITRTHELVQREIGTILGAGVIPVSIGGDHSLVIPGARALSEHLGPDKRMGYLQIDAHMDAGVDIGGELESNCSGLIRPRRTAQPLGGEHGCGRDPRNDQRPALVDRGPRTRHPDLPDEGLRQTSLETTLSDILDRVWDGVDGVYVTSTPTPSMPHSRPAPPAQSPAGFTSHEIIRSADGRRARPHRVAQR